MAHNYTTYLQTPIGQLKITANDKAVTSVHFVKKGEKVKSEKPNTVTHQCKKQLKEYFAGRRKKFELPLELEGTEFQKKVWKALMKIPYGETVSYGEIAKKIKNKKAVRAVGRANNKNKIAIVIPCHRVIGADGSLTGYAGGLEIKQWLLTHENANYKMNHKDHKEIHKAHKKLSASL